MLCVGAGVGVTPDPPTGFGVEVAGVRVRVGIGVGSASVSRLRPSFLGRVDSSPDRRPGCLRVLVGEGVRDGVAVGGCRVGGIVVGSGGAMRARSASRRGEGAVVGEAVGTGVGVGGIGMRTAGGSVGVGLPTASGVTLLLKVRAGLLPAGLCRKSVPAASTAVAANARTTAPARRMEPSISPPGPPRDQDVRSTLSAGSTKTPCSSESIQES